MRTATNNCFMAVFISFLIGLSGCQKNNCDIKNRELYRFDENASTRWASFENPTAQKGQAARENEGAKGYPYHVFKPGEAKVLLDTDRPGIIHRIWMTVDNLFGSPVEMRTMRIDMYWDGHDKPAVSAPLSDFFCMPLGRMVKFENELFASPEGKSFVCYIPMPYRAGARITLTNESAKVTHRVFYDINFSQFDRPDPDALYFHGHWRRENPTTLGSDFTILPAVSGKGRFLGAHIGVIIDKRNIGWWGEGEAKIYLDGDTTHPTLCGTGTEDYISTGWGQGQFINRFHGSLLSDNDLGLFGFYRFHIPDPVQFHDHCRVTLQQLGGTRKDAVKDMLSKGISVTPVAVIKPTGVQYNLLGRGGHAFDDEQFTDEMFTIYYRQDDVCSMAYFYLDSPVSDLPQLPPVSQRVENLTR